MMIDPRRAAAFFAERLAFQTDVSDVQAALATNHPGFVLIDARSRRAWDQGRIPGAVHLPHAQIKDRAAELLDPAVPVVAYCWGRAATAPPVPRSRCPRRASGRAR
jgi:rhodanese-related sulfurtransferase